jgi:hypothetical protein
MFLAAGTFASAAAPVLAESMNADEAKRFVAGKMFSFNCFEGTRGAGRIMADGSVAGSIQLAGAGPTRYVQLPANTLRVKGEAVCASLKGMVFEPCFNLVKTNTNSFRGSVSGLGFAYCDFVRRDGGRVRMARTIDRTRSARAAATTGSAPAAAPTPVSLELRSSQN